MKARCSYVLLGTALMACATPRPLPVGDAARMSPLQERSSATADPPPAAPAEPVAEGAPAAADPPPAAPVEPVAEEAPAAAHDDAPACAANEFRSGYFPEMPVPGRDRWTYACVPLPPQCTARPTCGCLASSRPVSWRECSSCQVEAGVVTVRSIGMCGPRR